MLLDIADIAIRATITDGPNGRARLTIDYEPGSPAHRQIRIALAKLLRPPQNAVAKRRAPAPDVVAAEAAER